MGYTQTQTENLLPSFLIQFHISFPSQNCWKKGWEIERGNTVSIFFNYFIIFILPEDPFIHLVNWASEKYSLAIFFLLWYRKFTIDISERQNKTTTLTYFFGKVSNPK